MRCALWLIVVACTPYSEVTTLVLRDPSRVTVAVATPSGPVELLHEGDSRADLPATSPPYLGVASSEGWIERDASRLDVWCPHCGDDKRRTPILDHRLTLDGTLALVTHAGSDVRAHFVFRSTPHVGDRPLPRLELELVTPADNVSSIHYDRIYDTDAGARRSGLASLVAFGAGLATAGTVAIAIGHHEREPGIEVIGVGPIVFGAALMLLAYSERDAPASTWRGRHHHR